MPGIGRCKPQCCNKGKDSILPDLEAIYPNGKNRGMSNGIWKGGEKKRIIPDIQFSIPIRPG